MNQAWLLERVMLLIPLLLSLTVHEFFHAWTAWRLGDDTAARAGRLTLNPVAHIDPIGTLLLPLLGVPFGWAKPVPVDVRRIRQGISMSTGNVLISAAGPISNLALAVLSSVAFALLFRFAPGVVERGGGGYELLSYMIIVNVSLAIFNLIPIPPLDGSHVAEAFVPYRLRPLWETFTRLSPFLLLGIFFFGSRIIAAPRNYVIGLLEQLIQAIA